MEKKFIFSHRASVLSFLAFIFLSLPAAMDCPCLAAADDNGNEPNTAKLLLDRDYYPALLAYIEGAQEEIVLVAFLFKTTDSHSNRPAAVIRKLIEARKRGINIRVVLENSGYDENVNKENRKVANLLQQNDITVRFDSAGKTTHAKIVVIDRRFILLGSHNLTNSALNSNHEVSMQIDDPAMAAELLNYIGKL